MRNVFLSLLAIAFVQPVHAFKDVFPEEVKVGSRYVRVTAIPEQMSIAFEDCVWGKPESCSTIGHKTSYRISDLAIQKQKEDDDIVWAAIGTAGAVIGGAYAGFLLGTVTVMAGAGKAAIIVGAGSGGLAASALGSAIDVINPAEQAREAKTISDEVVFDQNVEVKNINKFIERLNKVLRRIQ